MSHLVETMAYYGEIPWYKLGTKLNDKITAMQALSKAGLDWLVELFPCYVYINTELNKIEGQYAVGRTNNKNEFIDSIGIVGTKYCVQQNKELAQWADAITLASEGKAYCETAGSLQGGRKVWFLMKLGEAFKVNGDTSDILPYALLWTSHDGSTATEIFPTPVRVVCNNTLSLAISKNKSSKLKIRHTISAKQKFNEALRLVGGLNEMYDKFKVLADNLCHAKFTKAQYKLLVDNLIGKGKEEVATRTEESRDVLYNLLDKTPGAMPGTAWGAYQAIVDYADHYQGVRGDNESERRALSQANGTALALKDTALDIICQATKDNWNKMQTVVSRDLNAIADASSNPMNLLNEIIDNTLR